MNKFNLLKSISERGRNTYVWKTESLQVLDHNRGMVKVRYTRVKHLKNGKVNRVLKTEWMPEKMLLEESQ
jgi:hypothetical protein